MWSLIGVVVGVQDRSEKGWESVSSDEIRMRAGV